MKTAVTTFLSAVLMLTAMTFLPSCNSDDEQPSYPAHLSGMWVNTNASTGYIGFLSIEDISGGQYATFAVMSPTKELTNYSEGSFTYDSVTGTGTIRTGMVGGSTVSVYATSSQDSPLDVTVRQMVSGGSETVFQETFDKVSTVEFTTGKWSGEATDEVDTFNILLDITSISPKSGSCGTMTITASTGEKKITSVTEISEFAQAGSSYAVGLITLYDAENDEEITLVALYNTVTKNLVLASDSDATVKLSSVNVN